VPREHRILVSTDGLITIAGGKLTTYRVMGAQVVDEVARQLHALDGRRTPAAAATDREPLPGGEIADLRQLADELVKEGAEAAVAAHLAETYGAEATAVLHLAQREPDLAAPLAPGGPWLAAEVVHQARREMVTSVSDVLVRRLRLCHRLPGQAVDLAPRVAGLLADELGWDIDAAAASAAAYRVEVEAMQRAVRRLSAG
jgi:glycerol-3-phosphate dehydrogenase